jgi:hypothetical protein
MNWKEAFKKKNFRTEFFITVLFLFLILTALANFLNFVEMRNGVVLNDPLLNLFKPINLTWLSFSLIYISLFTAIFSFLKNPGLLLKAFQAYTVMVLFRITAMFLLPLDPPVGMIPLTDPLTEFIGTGQLISKDLFFSGHTATLFLLFLLVETKVLKIAFLVSTILVAISILLQHVHYSIDVFSAPFFTYCSLKITEILRRKFSLSAI